MSRLTNKNIVISGARCGYKDLFNKVYNKLGKLEDLEDELGCPLEVREKTLNSFYCPKFENDKKLVNYYVYAFSSEELFVRLIYNSYDDIYNEETTVLLEDYQKTWWLKGDRRDEDES